MGKDKGRHSWKLASNWLSWKFSQTKFWKMPNSEEEFQSYGIWTDSVIHLNGFHDKSLLEFFLSFMAKCVSPCMPSLLKARGCSTLCVSITVWLPSPPSRLPLHLPTRRAAKITNYPRASMYVCVLSPVSAATGTVAHQTLLSVEFSRQEYWTGLPFPPPGDLPDPGIKSVSLRPPALQADSLLLCHLGSLGLQGELQWLYS